MKTTVWMALALGLALGCGQAPTESPAPAAAVETAPVATRRVEVALDFAGRAEAARSQRLVALEEARVLEVDVADGASVVEGEQLFSLGGPRVEARRHALGVALDAARRRLAAARSRLDQATRRAATHLAEPGEVAAAEQDEASARAGLAEAKAALKGFSSALTVTAPASGRLVDRRVSRGQDVLRGELLARLLEPSSTRVTALVVPRAGLEPESGQTAIVERVAGEPLAARVSAVQAVTTPSGAAEVWLGGDALQALRPGTAVRGRIVVAVHERAIVVPERAVVRDRDDRPLVFVGRAPPFERRAVEIGERGPGWAEVTSGLGAEEQVVVRGAYGLYWADFAKRFKAED